MNIIVLHAFTNITFIHVIHALHNVWISDTSITLIHEYEVSRLFTTDI